MTPGWSQSEHSVLWLESIRRRGETGAIALWGAGAKGVTLANLVDPEQTLFECVVDVNPSALTFTAALLNCRMSLNP